MSDILLVIILGLCLYILWTRIPFYMLIFKIPGPLGLPFLGMAHKFFKREDILDVFEKNIKKYGSIFFSWLGPIPFLVVSEPQILQDILTSPYCDKGIVYESLDDGTGKGLFSLKSEKWNNHRKLLNPAFSNKVLISYLPIFNTTANDLLDNLKSFEGNDEHDLTEVFQCYTFNIATLTTMGKKNTLDNNKQNINLLRCYKCVLETMTSMCFSPWLKIVFFRRLFGFEPNYENSKLQIRKFIKNLISEQCSKDQTEIAETKVFINLCIDLFKKGNFSLQDVEDECNVIVFGAFETTANSIMNTLIMLAMFPRCQEKLYDELNLAFGDCVIFDISYEQLRQLNYMDMVINETMRVIAPVPLVSRQTVQDLKLSNGVVIPKNVQIVMDIFHMQRRTDIWGYDAHIFDPDHFLPANLQDKHPYAFIPFTKGKRICIGWRYGLLSMKVILAKIIKNYRFETTFKFDDLVFVEDITVKMKKMPFLKITKR